MNEASFWFFVSWIEQDRELDAEALVKKGK